jgi:hypothetical protein
MTLDDAFLHESYAENKKKWIDPVSAAVLAIDKYFHEILEHREDPGGLLPFGDFAFGVGCCTHANIAGAAQSRKSRF